MNALRRMDAVKTPLIVILGATGCGKSKLALELAQRYSGEVISADAMQVYKGLDIITNKVTKEEQQLVCHHMLNFVSPLKRFTVSDFAARALPVIDHLISKGKMPIIVGGTNYYIESLLWKVLIPDDVDGETLVLDKEAKKIENYKTVPNAPTELNLKIAAESGLVQGDGNCDVDNILKMFIAPDTMAEIPSNILHEALKKVDPKMANRLHPNEKRKIIRSLQVYQQLKRRHSEILEEQCALGGDSSLGGPLRYKDAIVFWLQCHQKVLNERLDARVESMIDQGLIEELLNFHAEYNKHRLSMNKLPDYTQGIFQSIGFKEFHEYLILSEEQRKSDHGRKLFVEGLELMKLVTRRYSRRQIKWIKNRFLRRDREVPPVYALDVTNPNQWEENVSNPSFEVIDALLNGHPVRLAPLPAEKEHNNIKESFYCEACRKTIIGTLVWEKHVNSRKHQKIKKKRDMSLQNLVGTLEKFEGDLRNTSEIPST